MVWAVGDIVEPEAQIRWIREAGFEGVGFHACRGALPYWAGIDPADCDAAARRRWRDILSGFALREIHAPFEIDLRDSTLAAGVAALAPIIAFGGDLGVDVVTVHAGLPPETAPAAPAWHDALRALSEAAGRANLAIGLEILSDFAWLDRWALPRVGVTLDVGHLCSAAGGPEALAQAGGVSPMIRRIGRHLVHLHVHDHNGQHDHIEAGTGGIDFASLFAGLSAIGYRRGMCLELNPSRCAPEGMVRSRAHLRHVASLTLTPGETKG